MISAETFLPAAGAWPRSNTRYELPRGGATLLGYVVRRMHKTQLLAPVPAQLRAGRPDQALIQVALYAAGASASYGPAYYQPEFDAVGAQAVEADPVTGAEVQARLTAVRPHFQIAYAALLAGVGRFAGEETITGTTVGLTGLGMPAPARLSFTSADGAYTVALAGTITSELLPGFFGRSRIRAVGELQFHDNAGQHGRVTLARAGRAQVNVETAAGGRLTVQADFSPPRG